MKLQKVFVLVTLACAFAEEQEQQQHVRRAQEEEGEYGEIIQHGYTNRLTGGQGIVGGTQASAGEFPWFVAFDPLVQCGGSLIAPNRVLTAAHCVKGGTPENVLVGPTTNSDGEKIAVTCGSYHPDYYIGRGGDLFNDVAVLKLAGSSDVTPIKLNSDINYPSVAGTPMTVIGYGRVSEGGRVSQVLKKLGTFFQTIESCQGTYPNVEFGTHVCGNVDNSGDCQGTQLFRMPVLLFRSLFYPIHLPFPFSNSTVMQATAVDHSLTQIKHR